MKVWQSSLSLLMTAVLLVTAFTKAEAQESESDLAKKTQNPVADLISIPLQNNMGFGIGPNHRTRNDLNIQPVVPLNLNSEWNLITRTILPIIKQPMLSTTSDNTWGIGNTSFSAFLSPAKSEGFIWGVGPIVELPTTSDDRLGTRRWSAGPTAVALTVKGPWVFGILGSQVWSFAGSSDNPNVSRFLTQYFINYNFGQGWYVGASPIITADWQASGGNKWTVPVGGELAKSSASESCRSMQMWAITLMWCGPIRAPTQWFGSRLLCCCRNRFFHTRPRMGKSETRISVKRWCFEFRYSDFEFISERGKAMRKQVMGIVTIALAAGLAMSVQAADNLDRTVLPIPEPKPPVYTALDAREVKPPPRFEVTAPKDAPNVLLIMIDDMGFGMSSAFGGPIHMPTAERLSHEGLRYNQFHTTALCSPTRAALLSGRNHHMNNMGGITEIATAFPGNTGQRPRNVAPLAEMLRLNGYSTAFFGKNHETAAWEVSPSGPTDRWPTRSGFDKFYGFIGGETNQWAPLVYDGLSQVEVPKDPNYHFMNDMTNQAIHWMRYQKSLTPDKPFFIYFAPGATHAPHHVPKEWIEKYKGKFDGGWDQFREETLARQIKLGVVPEGTKLAGKPKAIKDWDKLSADEKKLFSRQMEIFAGFGEYTDVEIGRLVQAVEQTGQMDNTLIFYIIGDNGTSAEGGMNGMFNEMTYFNQVHEKVEDILQHYDELGGPMSYPHMAAGWAVAGDTPFMWTKQIPSNFGGTRNGLVVHWPKRIKAKGEVRTQFHHVIDVAPTVLEAAGLPEPNVVNGTKQLPIEGVSMAYSFNDAKGKGRHKVQYFEILGNRGIYADGWFAGTIHRAPWEYEPRTTLQKDKWELYDTRNDFSLANDLSAKNPAKLKELQGLFMKEAVKYRVLPIDDRTVERFNPKLAGRPDLMGGRTSLTVYEGMTGMSENVFINTKNRSHTITAEVEIPEGGASGVILAQAGRFGGWSLYIKDGKPVYTYNFVGLQKFHVSSDQVIPAGKATILYEFTYDGPGMGKGGSGRISVNGQKVAEGKIEHTQCCVFSADEGADVGRDDGTPVSEDYTVEGSVFTGKIHSVTIELKSMKSSAKEEADKARMELARKKALSD